MPGIGTVHTLGTLRFMDGTAMTPAEVFALDGLSDRQLDPAANLLLLAAAGQADSSFVGVITQDPMITFTTHDLKKCFDNSIAPGVLAVDPAAGAGVVKTAEAYFTQMAKRGIRSGASAHFRATVNDGMVSPGELTCRHGEAARLTGTLHAIYDGTNNPFVYANSVSLPATPALDDVWTLGRIDLQGAEISGPVGLTLNFGIGVVKRGGKGEVYPTFAGVTTRQPTLEINTLDVPALSTYGLSGAEASAAVTVYLQKMDKMATREAAGSSVHIKITFATSQALITTGAFGGANNAEVEGVIRVTPIVGASAIMTIATTSTIP